MGTSILNIGVTGLRAAQTGILTTGHNISNASTPGFNRQEIVQSTNIPQYTGAGFLGQGTEVSTVRRVYSQFLGSQVLNAQTREAELGAYRDQIAQIDNLLADSSTGLSPALQEFFKSVGEVAANPASAPARQSLLSAAQALASRFQSLDRRLEDIREGVNIEVSGAIGAINSYALQIADLNERIVVAQSAAQGQPANDLLDQRDQLIAELNKEVRVTTSTETNGSMNVFIGNGQSLVVGAKTMALTAGAAVDDPRRIEVSMVKLGGGTVPLQETLFSGGRLGGVLTFRSETLDSAQNALGRIAIGLTQTFNDQHKLGQDLFGNLGGNFFAVPSNPQVFKSSTNAGTAAVSATISDFNALSNSDYRITYAGGNYTLIRLSDNTVTSLGAFAAPVVVDGVTFSKSDGASGPVAGDTFLIQPTRTGARDMSVAIGDVRNIAAAAPVRTSTALANSGSARISAGSVGSTGGLPLAASPGGDITLTFNAAQNRFDVTGGPGGTLAYDPSTESAGKSFTLASVGSFTFSVSGMPADGDKFVIARNANGVSDNRNMLALGQLQTKSTLIGGTVNYQSAFSQIVAEVGNKAREVQVGLTAQENLASQALASQQSLSGVNLDEEAANLLRYQQAYQAAGKMIQVASKLFEELLALNR
jgi:flagellar hook-associated protein 1 FlgK